MNENTTEFEIHFDDPFIHEIVFIDDVCVYLIVLNRVQKNQSINKKRETYNELKNNTELLFLTSLLSTQLFSFQVIISITLSRFRLILFLNF